MFVLVARKKVPYVDWYCEFGSDKKIEKKKIRSELIVLRLAKRIAVFTRTTDREGVDRTWREAED